MGKTHLVLSYLVKSAGTGAVTKEAMGRLWTCWNILSNSQLLAINSCLEQVLFWWSTSWSKDSSSSVSCASWLRWPAEEKWPTFSCKGFRRQNHTKNHFQLYCWFSWLHKVCPVTAMGLHILTKCSTHPWAWEVYSWAATPGELSWVPQHSWSHEHAPLWHSSHSLHSAPGTGRKHQWWQTEAKRTFQKWNPGPLFAPPIPYWVTSN